MRTIEELELDVSLTWHLRSNHYPPYPLEMVEVAKAAIEAANEEDWDREIVLPEGITYRGGFSVRAGQVVEDMHLEFYVGDCDD